MIRSAPAAASFACAANRSRNSARAVVAGKHEQIVEGRDLLPKPPLRQPLIQAVEKSPRSGYPMNRQGTGA